MTKEEKLGGGGRIKETPRIRMDNLTPSSDLNSTRTHERVLKATIHPTAYRKEKSACIVSLLL